MEDDGEADAGLFFIGEVAFCLSLFCHGYMFAVREWFLHGQEMSIDEVADCMISSIPVPLKPFML